MNALLYMIENTIVTAEKENPELDGSGFLCSATNETNKIPSIIADSSILDNKEFAMTSGYIRIPRSLTDDPLWSELSPKCQIIFYKIVELALYKPKEFNDHGKILSLNIGQICITQREFLTKLGKHFSKNDVHRNLLNLKTCRFLNLEVNHTKTIITITHKDTYDLIKRSSEPRNEPGLNQDRTRIEPEKKKEKKVKKEKQHKAPPSLDAISLFEFFNLSLKKHIPEVVEPCKPETAIHFDALLKKNYTPEEIRNVTNFCHTGWWAKHVHCPKYLRDKFTKLLAAMRRDIPIENKNKVDRRTRNQDGTPVDAPHLKDRF